MQPPRHRDLAVRQVGPGAVGVVEQQVDLAVVGRRVRPTEPAKSTSSGFSARSSPGLIEPVAQRIESETFDFPEPFGPTTTATPGSRWISTGSTNDLKPRSLIAFRCTRRGGYRAARTPPVGSATLARSSAAERLAARPPARRLSSSGRVPVPTTSSSISAAAVNERSCGGPSTLDGLVRDRAAGAREPLLQLRLVVDVRRQRVLDARLERLDDRRLDRLEAVLEVRAPRSPPRAARRARCGSRRAARRRRRQRRASPRRRSPRPSPRATTAQLARETTCERTFAIRPSANVGEPVVERRARPRARAPSRPGTRAARTRLVRSAAHDECVKTAAARSAGSSSISSRRGRVAYWCEVT